MKKILLLLTLIVPFLLHSCFVDDTINAIDREFKPSALLKKYEYYKDLSSGIDKKDAEILMYQSEIKELQADSSMDKDDKFYLQQRKSELIGVIGIRNQMCAEYNSAMSKFNYSFCNVGTMPQSNLTPLPREYKPYVFSTK